MERVLTRLLSEGIKKLERCPECKGTGKYIGFTQTEECRLCLGAGTIGPNKEGLIKALQSWIDEKNAEEPNPRWKPLTDTRVVSDPVRMHKMTGYNTPEHYKDAVMLTYDGAGYDYLSYQADYGGIWRKDVKAIAKKYGYEVDDYSTWAMSFYPEWEYEDEG